MAEDASMVATSNEEGDSMNTESIAKREQNNYQTGTVQKNGKQNKEVKK